MEKNSSDYPASEWTLTYYLRKDGATATKLYRNTADEDSFLVTVVASTTSSYAAGVYGFIGVVSKAAEKFIVFDGVLEVLTNPASPSAYDHSKNFKKPLTAGRFRSISTKTIGYR